MRKDHRESFAHAVQQQVVPGTAVSTVLGPNPNRKARRSKEKQMKKLKRIYSQ